jgi:hypothetical protein
MYLHRQSVRDFMHASEALLKTHELTDTVLQAIAEMLYRLSEKLLNPGNDGTRNNRSLSLFLSRRNVHHDYHESGLGSWGNPIGPCAHHHERLRRATLVCAGQSIEAALALEFLSST